MSKVQVNTLWSLENIKDQYIFDTETLDITNIWSGRIISVYIDKRGYPAVSMSLKNPTKTGRRYANVKYHKIIALACINNGPYKLIEHLDDNPLNFHPSNLKFSTQTENAKTMRANGINNHIDSIFELMLTDGTKYIGTTKEISEQSGIRRGAIYDKMYQRYDKSHTRTQRKYNIQHVKLLYSGNERRNATKKEKVLRERDSDGFLILHRINNLNRFRD